MTFLVGSEPKQYRGLTIWFAIQRGIFGRDWLVALQFHAATGDWILAPPPSSFFLSAEEVLLGTNALVCGTPRALLTMQNHKGWDCLATKRIFARVRISRARIDTPDQGARQLGLVNARIKDGASLALLTIKLKVRGLGDAGFSLFALSFTGILAQYLGTR